MRIGLIGYDDINALDLVGPLEAFSTANQLSPGNGRFGPPYQTVVIGLGEQSFRAESGARLMPDCTLATAPSLDTLVIPGGRGLRRPEANAAVAAWIAAHAPSIRRIASVCTGIYGLAPTGLLDGARVTTHWQHARDVGERFPRLTVDSDALFLQHGRCYTSAGVTAGIDLALALIEEDLGRRLALGVAREMVVYLKRAGGQQQYSEPLRLQSCAPDGFADIATWICTHLNGDLSVAALAARACLSPRQFSRRFTAAFGCTVAAYVENLRLAEARQRLGESGAPIDRIAHALGYRSADAFRRAFERKFGLTPGSYRERLGLRAAPDARQPVPD